jgi:hypothetical protein
MKNYLFDAMSDFISSFDGENIRYHSSEKKLQVLIAQVQNGPERDFMNFSHDMYTAIRQENERKERISS